MDKLYGLLIPISEHKFKLFCNDISLVSLVALLSGMMNVETRLH